MGFALQPALFALYGSIVLSTTVIATVENFSAGDNPWPCLQKGAASGALAGLLAVVFKVSMGI